MGHFSIQTAQLKGMRTFRPESIVWEILDPSLRPQDKLHGSLYTLEQEDRINSLRLLISILQIKEGQIVSVLPGLFILSTKLMKMITLVHTLKG